MFLAAVVVTYNYNPQTLLTNIASYADEVDLLIVWDNNLPKMKLDAIAKRWPNARISQTGKNVGLAIAYNQAFTFAAEQGCTHLMTMDQDSTFEDFPKYKEQIAAFNDPSVGIFTCPINNDIAKIGYRETTVCQSGSVYTIDMLNSIGGFREDFFIGMVDAEMSLRALEKGYKIFQFSGCNLIQHIGAGRIVNFLGKRIEVSDYSPLRHYYDSRNRILLWHEFTYDYSTKHKLQWFLSRMKLITKIILFENNKIQKVSAIMRGTFNGILNHTKPY